jgi:uncharacterized membrane protein
MAAKNNLSKNTFSIIAILVIAVIVALLLVPIHVSIILFVLSTIGIGIGFVAAKPELTPEDELRKTTIEQYQVPETRGALLKFAIEATQKIKPVSPIKKIFSQEAKRQVWLNEIWTNKCIKVYTTARFAMKDDAKSLTEITQLINNAGIKV